jgi:hypothetical protein
MKESRLKLAQDQAGKALVATNKAIEELGAHTHELYQSLSAIQKSFDLIRNVPSETRIRYEKLKAIRLAWKEEAEKIESDNRAATLKNAGAGAAGVGAGVAVAALGPSAAMGIATTFGVASTGTAISTLSGAAATNAALAWLGGGALAAGGGGTAAGSAFLALAGPVGWAIAGVAIVGSGALFFLERKQKKRLDDLFSLISERDTKSFALAFVEIGERISRVKQEVPLLEEANERIKTFGLDYEKMSERERYELGADVNLMNASLQLLVNPILGLQPRYTEAELDAYLKKHHLRLKPSRKPLVLALANLLKGIPLEEKDWRLLWKTLRKNKDFVHSFRLEKSDFDYSLMEMVQQALQEKPRSSGSH